MENPLVLKIKNPKGTVIDVYTEVGVEEYLNLLTPLESAIQKQTDVLRLAYTSHKMIPFKNLLNKEMALTDDDSWNQMDVLFKALAISSTKVKNKETDYNNLKNFMAIYQEYLGLKQIYSMCLSAVYQSKDFTFFKDEKGNPKSMCNEDVKRILRNEEPYNYHI